jgi:hypothetical protein
MDGLRTAADAVERPAELGELEISVTPWGRVTQESVNAFAELGVHRLVPMIGRDDVRSVVENAVAASR